MSRSRVLLVMLAMSLLASACSAGEYKVKVTGCQDLSVGEQTDVVAVYGLFNNQFDRGVGRWTNVSGPGTLGPTGEFWKARYTATDAGIVSLSFEGFGIGSIIAAIGEGDFGDAIPLETARFTALCDFEVFDALSATVVAEGTRFEITATVTVLTVEGLLQIGDVSTAVWRFVFDCPDGRCDAVVHDGGPYGVLAPFTATYQDDVENFVFDFVLDTPANQQCGDDRWVGEINPLGWDEQGPVEFTFNMVNVLVCDTGDLVIEWEGEATRG